MRALLITSYAVMAFAMCWGGLKLALRKVKVDLFSEKEDTNE